MNLFRAADMRAADQTAIQAGIASLLLMDAAARQVAEHTWAFAERNGYTHVLVLCGKGNNGGDGYGAARYLAQMELSVHVLELATDDYVLLGNDTGTMRRACVFSVPCETLTLDSLTTALTPDCVVVDALFGSGLNRALEGELAELVSCLNDATYPVVSVDVPSGISADTGRVLGPHVRANLTVQLAGAKLASALYPARAAFGEQVIADIGLPADILDTHRADIALLDDDLVMQSLQPRAPDAHKYTVGTVLVVAGSARYLGAAALACHAALRTGAGLVTLAAETQHAGLWPEVVLEPLDWQTEPLATLQDLADKRAGVTVIGPGLDALAEAHLPELIRAASGPLVLDAGALTGGKDWLAAVVERHQHGQVTVLTPHLGEAARLLGTSTSAVVADPLATAASLATQTGALIVLKGATTVIANILQTTDGQKEHQLAISAEGHAGMATGGSGDVLAGVLGALLAAWAQQPGDVSLFDCVCAGVYVHGRAGKRAGYLKSVGMLPGDVIESLPKVIEQLTPKVPK
ncbi:MAG: NAD(P)H-hydrate dehydratase [Deinococcota bacterium]